MPIVIGFMSAPPVDDLLTESRQDDQVTVLSSGSLSMVVGRQDRGDISGTVEDTDDRDILLRCHKEDHVVAVGAGADVIPEFWS